MMMHPHQAQGILPMMMPPPPPRGSQQQQPGVSNRGSLGGPDLLSSLKPCALPEDMPLPVSSNRAAAAAAAAAEAEGDDDDTVGFDWQGLARPSSSRPQPKGSAEALAAASQRIAIITGAAEAPAGPSPAAAHRARPAATVPAVEAKQEGPVHGTDALGRKVWDKEYYEAKAKEKAAAAGGDEFLDLLPKPREKPKPPPLPPCGYRQQLQQRTFQLDFEREVGKTKMVTLQTPRMQQGGFWCDICECLCKDSQSYLDHINGRNHNRILGMSMRVERVPLPRVKAKLQAARRELAAGTEGTDTAKAEIGAKVSAAPGASLGPPAEDEFDRVKRRIEELQKEQELKKQRKKEKKRKAAATSGNNGSAANAAKDPSNAANPDASALASMGLPTSFI